MSLSPRHLDAFRATVRTGSTVAAARALNTSQPSISRSIAQLEQAVGMTLFERVRSQLKLTGEGELFFAEVDAFFIGTDELMNRAREIREFRSVELRIATIAAGALLAVPRAIAELSCDFPDLRSSLFQRSHFRTREMVASGRVDVGLCNAATEGDGIGVVHYAAPACLMALPPGHRLAEVQQVTAKDLEGEAFISLGQEFYGRSCKDAEVLDRLAAATRSKCNLSLPLARMVAAGSGIGLIDPLTAQVAGSLGIVTRRFDPPIAYPLSVVTSATRPKTRHRSALVKRLVASLPTT